MLLVTPIYSYSTFISPHKRALVSFGCNFWFHRHFNIFGLVSDDCEHLSGTQDDELVVFEELFLSSSSLLLLHCLIVCNHSNNDVTYLFLLRQFTMFCKFIKTRPQIRQPWLEIERWQLLGWYFRFGNCSWGLLPIHEIISFDFHLA